MLGLTLLLLTSTAVVYVYNRHLDADVSKMFISADKVIVACGTRPLRPDVGVPFDGKTVFDSDQLLWGKFSTVPRDIIVIGAGVIGLEYASMFNIIPGFCDLFFL